MINNIIAQVNTAAADFTNRLIEAGYISLHFIMCCTVVVCGLILIVRFARNWPQRLIIAGLGAALLIGSSWICRSLLMPFFGMVLQACITVSMYCIIAVLPILLLARWIWTSFTKHL